MNGITKINKPINIFESQERKRPISAPRFPIAETNHKHSFSKFQQHSAKNSVERNTSGNKQLNSSYQQIKKDPSKIKVDPSKVIKTQESGSKSPFNKLSPFDQKSRNSLQKKGNTGTHYTSTYKSKGQLGITSKTISKKQTSFSPNAYDANSRKTPDRNNILSPGSNKVKSIYSPANFSKIVMKKKRSKIQIGEISGNLHQSKMSQVNRSITPIIKPKLSASSIQTKQNHSRTRTPTGYGNYSPFNHTMKSPYGFKNNNASHKNLQIISDKDGKNGHSFMFHLPNSSKLKNFKSKNCFIPHNNSVQKTKIITGTMQQDVNTSNISSLSTFSPNNQGNANKDPPQCTKAEEKQVTTEGNNASSQSITMNKSKVMPLPLISLTAPLSKSLQPNNKPMNQPLVKSIKRMHEFSKTGYAGEDEKKVNQDNYFVFRNFVNSSKNIFMAVCDGHGAYGQEVSGFIKENLPNDLNRAIQTARRNLNEESIIDLITQIFIQTNEKLIKTEMINSMLSGSTCVSVIYTPHKLITANVGDSRAILGKCVKGNWKSFDITRDHKPGDKDELKRIHGKGGRVEPMRDDEDGSFIGPPRVWVQDDEYPGLAMSRSFGDKVAHSLGVISEPEIKEFAFEAEDKFFIVASDGLFEFITSQEIVDIVKDYYLTDDIVGCCEYLYSFSSAKWIKEEEVIDDITMIIVFLEDE